MSAPPILFGTDGWRGRIARELTFESLGRVVDAMAAWTVSPENPDPGDPWTLSLVHDMRFLSPELAAESATRLASRGFRVLLTDRPVPTPCASWHVKAGGLRGGLAITASHNPAEWNGVKYKAHFGGSAPPETYAAIAERAGEVLPPRQGGSVERLDLVSSYLAGIAAAVDLPAIRGAGLRVLFDSMHGAAARLLEEIVGPGHPTRVTTIRGHRDPTFGGVNPEPIAENLGASREALGRASYDVALSSDGDGDRLGVMAADGRFITPARVLALLAESLFSRGRLARGGGIVKTFSTSLVVDRAARSLGAPLAVTPIGFKYIAERMLAGQAAIGGEESGGLGVDFYLPERDGILSALLVLEAIAHAGGSFDELLRHQEREHGVLHYGRRDLHLPMVVLRAFVERLRSSPPGERCGEKVTSVETLDGVKLVLGGRGWILHRLSGTEPIIRIYAEHEDERVVAKLLDSTEAELRASAP